jgi:hypothetical protein
LEQGVGAGRRQALHAQGAYRIARLASGFRSETRFFGREICAPVSYTETFNTLYQDSPAAGRRTSAGFRSSPC